MTDLSPEELKFVVESLNQAPFNRKLTLVSFSQLPGPELLQLLNDVFAELDPRQKREVRNENPDISAARLLEFIMVLNYKLPTDLSVELIKIALSCICGCDSFTFSNSVPYREQLMAGSPSVIHPLMHYVLSKQPSLKKRAYLARFLKPVEVPEEHFADPGQAVSIIITLTHPSSVIQPLSLCISV